MDTATMDQQQATFQDVGLRRCSALVIADAGDSAWMVVLDLPVGARLGRRFSYRGLMWQITHYRPHARAWVAEPTRH